MIEAKEEVSQANEYVRVCGHPILVEESHSAICGEELALFRFVIFDLSHTNAFVRIIEKTRLKDRKH